VIALAHLLSRKLREVLVLEVLARVLAEDGVDEGVVDVAAHTDGGVDLGELLDDEDRAGERGAGASVVGRSLDAHQLGGASRTLSVSEVVPFEPSLRRNTHALLKEALDDGRVHLFVLVHLGHLGSNDLVRKLLDCARTISCQYTADAAGGTTISKTRG
jgi:hypothetical protein